MNFTLLVYIALGLSVISAVFGIVFFVRFQTYKKKQDELLAGEEVQSLEEIVLRHKKRLATHHKNIKEIGEILEELVEKNRKNIQRVGLVRFNPFEDTGGDISFALALLDREGDGIVISSLHSREGTRIYSKPVKGGDSENHLTEEEKQAITKALS